MESRDFIEFVKVKDHMLAVQFSIATKKFESFRKPFVTNKYLSLIQWEEIMFTINRVLSKQLKLSEDEQLKTKGEFTIDESLQVTYRAKPRDECYIDFNKLDFRYNLHWIFSVAVSRPEKKPSKEPPAQAEKSPKSTRSSQKSSNSVVSIASTISVPSEQEYDPSPETKELMSRYTPGKSEGPNRQALGSPEYCPQSTDKSQPSSSTYTASRIARNGVDFEQAIGISKIQKQLFGSSDEDNSPMVLLSPESGKTSVVRVKKRGLLATVPEVPDTNTPTQKKIARWLNTSTYFKDPPVPKISSRSSRTKSKDQEAGTSSKNPRTTKENTNPIDDLFDEEKMKQMKDFVASSLSRQEQRKARKKELEDYEMKDCTDLSNAELKRAVKEFAPTILKLYTSTSSRYQRFNPVLLTTGNILSESQLNFVLNEIENQRPVSERGSREDVLTEIVLPELILYLFRQKFDFSFEQALAALNLQEEYTMLHLKDEAM